MSFLDDWWGAQVAPQPDQDPGYPAYPWTVFGAWTGIPISYVAGAHSTPFLGIQFKVTVKGKR